MSSMIEDLRVEHLRASLGRLTVGVRCDASDSIYFRDQLKVVNDGFEHLLAQINAWITLVELGSIQAVPSSSTTTLQGEASQLYEKMIYLETQLYRAKAEKILLCG